ncbi:MAG: hypothetical protein GY952_08565 [Rhodobacteraceae bacterium]|nr:hypothetical protein [Paracoccaceae bacterium]
MKLARAIQFDESDRNVFHNPAATGEWVISGGFEFSNWTEADLTGKARQAFANGWLGLENFGRVTFAAVTRIEPREFDALTNKLALHFIEVYGAPSVEAARGVALDELNHMRDACEDHDANTLLSVQRELTKAGVREQFRFINSEDAGLEQFAVHGDSES